MTLDKVKLKTINNQSVIGDGNISVGGSSVDIVTSWSSTTSDSKVPSEKLAKNSLDDKISKSQTSGLVKNDGSIDTTSYLSSLPSHNHDDRYYTKTEMDTALNGKVNSVTFGLDTTTEELYVEVL